MIMRPLAMAHDELERLSRDELLELLARQTEVIGRQQEELAEREAAIERRDEKIRELEEELAQFRRPAKTPENSSVPRRAGSRQTGWQDDAASWDRSGGTSGSAGYGASRMWWSRAARARARGVARRCRRPGGSKSGGVR
jgi:hypothetical protein